MSNNNLNFKKSLLFEILLIIFFVAAFILYSINLVPVQFSKIFFSIAGIIGLIPVVKSAAHSLKRKQINVDLLAAIALIFSFLSEEWGSMLFINLMLSGARVLELYTRRRVRVSLESLAKLKPLNARVSRGSNIAEIPLAEVTVGDHIVVNLGEQIPVDGTIINGTATINQASLTGESMPVLRGLNEKVFCATVVVSGNIIVRAERIGAETIFERMIKLVDASSSAKTRMKTLAERFASWYIGIMLAVAIILFLATNNTQLVLAVILVVCADDIAIAIPIAYIAAIGTGARRGIIIKGADILERVAKITTLIVDKTGTLTLGKLAVTDIYTFEGYNNATVLKMASALCGQSNHPVSVAIREYAGEQGYRELQFENYKEIEGRGIIAINKQGEKIILGRLEFLTENGVIINQDTGHTITDNITKGNNVTILSVDSKVVGVFSLMDQIRTGMRSIMQTLKERGVKEIIMLTGDNEGTAKNIASKLGIEKYYSKLMPEHKVYILQDHLGKHNRVVSMVGDGVNDAAVLALSDVGIAMGEIGADAAIESADIVLMQDDFKKILEARTLSEKVRSVVYENFAIWGVVNIIGLYFVFTYVFDPARAAAYNFLTDFIPIINSLRLLHTKEEN